MKTDSLTVTERLELAQHEAVIERGLQTFVEVGQALLAIRDGRLYRQDHATFEDYCRDRWNFDKRRAYQLMDAAQVVNNVNHGSHLLPANERQARPLTALEPDEQREVWQEAVETAPNGRVTAKHVEDIVKRQARREELERAYRERAQRSDTSITLYEGDAFEIVPTLDDGSVALVVADPPYNVTGHDWDQIGDDEAYLDFTRRWLGALRPKLAADYHLYVFCSPSYAAQTEMLLRADGWPLKSRIIWSHRNLSRGRVVADKYITMWEMCFHVGTHALNLPEVWDDQRFEVKEVAAPQSNFNEGKYHPTAKPVALIRQFVEHGSLPGDLVLDPFAGGGTTGAACAEVGGRQCLLVEREPDYCDAIRRRLGVV